jgi:hypothetical protein
MLLARQRFQSPTASNVRQKLPLLFAAATLANFEQKSTPLLYHNAGIMSNEAKGGNGLTPPQTGKPFS